MASDKLNLNFSDLFHESSKDHSKGHPPIPHDPSNWPDEWKTIYYKTYPRLDKIKLSEEKPRSDFFELILKRRSTRDFSKKTISKKDLSILLQYSSGITDKESGKRAQPSGGGRYPIEIYPIIFSGNEEIPSGVYHYNVKDHALDILWKKDLTKNEIDELFTYPWVSNASAVFIMTTVFPRNKNKYGERGYRYILIEAGHIAQNLHLASEAFNIKCCALGGTKDVPLEMLLDIDGITESVVYAIAIG